MELLAAESFTPVENEDGFMCIAFHKIFAQSFKKGILMCRPDSVLRNVRRKAGRISHETSNVSKG